MELLDEYEEVYNRNIKDKSERKNKISGNVFAHLMRRNIYELVKDKFDVSVVNSYIKTCNTEWDMLILKKGTLDLMGDNVYPAEDVIAAFEFKTSGLFTQTIDESLEYIQVHMEELKEINKNIKYGYVSLCERPKHLEAIQKKIAKNSFWIIEGYYRDREKEKTKKNSYKEFEKFVNNLIK